MYFDFRHAFVPCWRRWGEYGMLAVLQRLGVAYTASWFLECNHQVAARYSYCHRLPRDAKHPRY